MAYLNQVHLIGAVGNDPEVRATQGGAKVASFHIATTERYKDRDGNPKEQTEWHTVIVWNAKADFVEKYIHKGSSLFVSGKLATRSWTDQSGNKRYNTEVVADNIQILDRKPKETAAPVAAAEDEDLPDFLR